MPLISVILPTYNVEKYICEAIDSILNQSFSDFELIIVDDCSTDNTYSLCLEYASVDKRVKVFRNEENSKIEFSLNKALSLAKGYYVVRMDGDDISEPKRLEIMKGYLEDHPDIVLVGTSTITINAEGQEIGRTVFFDDLEVIERTCLFRTPVIHIWMTYKWVYEQFNGYRKFFGSEDYDFVLRVMSAGYKCTNISDYYGYRVRIHRDGNTTSTFGVRKLKSKWYTIKLYKERKKNGKDSYSEQSCQNASKTFPVNEAIYSLSNNFLYKAIACKSQKKFFAMLAYIVMSCISPYQIAYFVEIVLYKIFSRGALK